jgi:hypothetical protein
MKYQCTNKCCLEQYDIKEGEPLICQICNFGLERIYEVGTLIILDKIKEQIETHGANRVFKSIDNFSNPLQRASYRKYFLEAIKTLGLKWEYDKEME